MTQISPDLFMDALFGYQKAAAIKAALALDLFTAIAATGGDVDGIAARTDASVRGVRILCDYLTVQGFLDKEQTRYRLTPATEAFLTTTSPAWMGSVADFAAAPEMMALWLDDPVSYVRFGGAAGLGSLAPGHPVWVKFAKAMVPFIGPTALAVAAEVAAWPAPPRKVLDVAAGHGMFGITIAKAAPHAEITAIDWQAVLEVAEANAAEAGMSARYHARPGSAFELDWGSDFDLVLLANFLHHFDAETCIDLLAKARGSLTPNGRVLAVEFVPNEDRVSPPFPAMFAFMMLGSTPHGDAYTARQFEEMGRSAGFLTTTIKPLLPTPQSLVSFEPA